MTTSLATYISLPGSTEEAFRHWHDVFGGELDLMKYHDMPTEDMPFEPDPNAVAHVVLTLPGGVITGGDVMDEKDYPIRDTAYSLLYTLDDPDQAREVIQKLVDAGGSQAMPFERAPWGDWYGQVFDRFGVMWAFSVENAAGDDGSA